MDLNKYTALIQRAADTLPMVAQQVSEAAETIADFIDLVAEKLEDVAEAIPTWENEGGSVKDEEPTLTDLWQDILTRPGPLSDNVKRVDDLIDKHGYELCENTIMLLHRTKVEHPQGAPSPARARGGIERSWEV